MSHVLTFFQQSVQNLRSHTIPIHTSNVSNLHYTLYANVSWNDAVNRVITVLEAFPLGCTEAILHASVIEAPIQDDQDNAIISEMNSSTSLTVSSLKVYRAKIIRVTPFSTNSSCFIMDLLDSSGSISAFVHAQFATACLHWTGLTIRMTNLQRHSFHINMNNSIKCDRVLPTRHIVVELPRKKSGDIFRSVFAHEMSVSHSTYQLIFGRIRNISVSRRCVDADNRIAQCIHLDGCYRENAGVISFVLWENDIALANLLHKNEIIVIMNAQPSSHCHSDGEHTHYFSLGPASIVHVILHTTIFELIADIVPDSIQKFRDLFHSSLASQQQLSCHQQATDTLSSLLCATPEVCTPLSQAELTQRNTNTSDDDETLIIDMKDWPNIITVKELENVKRFENVSLLAVVLSKRNERDDTIIELNDASNECWHVKVHLTARSSIVHWHPGHCVWMTHLQSIEPSPSTITAQHFSQFAQTSKSSTCVNISMLKGFLCSPFLHLIVPLRHLMLEHRHGKYAPNVCSFITTATIIALQFNGVYDELGHSIDATLHEKNLANDNETFNAVMNHHQILCVLDDGQCVLEATSHIQAIEELLQISAADFEDMSTTQKHNALTACLTGSPMRFVVTQISSQSFKHWCVDAVHVCSTRYAVLELLNSL